MRSAPLMLALALALTLPASFSCRLLDRGSVVADVDPPCAQTTDPGPDRAACAFGAGALARETIACPASGSRIPVEHVIVVMQENRSFDHYLGHLPEHGQDDVDVADGATSNGGVGWFHAPEACFDDPDHSWAGSHLAWGGGRNDGFVAASAAPNDPEGTDPAGVRAMGYYDQGDIPFSYWLASTFATSDRYFADLLGPTFPNRLYLYAGTSFGLVTNDFDTSIHRTIFSELNDRGVSWKVYRSDVAAALITASFLEDSVGNVSSIDDFIEDARAGNLPQVAWIDANFLITTATRTSEEPPADMQVGQHFVYRLVQALASSPSWATSAMFITYDEAGGLYDHVPPPAACAPGDAGPAQGADLGGFDRYGFRVPVFVVSPFARAHFVSHAVHSHTSILRFIEAKFGVPALTARDANSDAMLDMFDFANPPFLSAPALSEPPVDGAQLEACTRKYGL